MPTRGGYDRKSGSYAVAKKESKKKVKQVTKKSAEIQEKESEKEERVAEKSSQVAKSGSWEEAAKPWLGTPYKYGGSSKSGIDCSGFVMQLYKEMLGMSLPHKASEMYDMGSSVSKGNLKEGDLVFFGSVWDIDHVGIYLSGDRFVHASSSKGVMISPMDNVYWAKRYQGARRLK